MTISSDALPAVAAVVVTRNRIDMLRMTLKSIQASTYPVTEIVVSDDGADDTTTQMLVEEFPGVLRVEGPRRGISANRNKGMSHVKADYILLSDDDMSIDANFVELAMPEILAGKHDLMFAGMGEYGEVIFPNTVSFLGYSTKAYKPGEPYNTANQQAFLLNKKILSSVQYDELIRAYGNEEIDFAYRVAAAGYSIGCVRSCTQHHLGADPTRAARFEKDGCRIYVTYKRYTYINRQPLKGLAFLVLAIPHHILSSVRRVGLRTGLSQSISNFKLAWSMLAGYRNQQRKHAAS